MKISQTCKENPKYTFTMGHPSTNWKVGWPKEQLDKKFHDGFIIWEHRLEEEMDLAKVRKLCLAWCIFLMLDKLWWVYYVFLRHMGPTGQGTKHMWNMVAIDMVKFAELLYIWLYVKHEDFGYPGWDWPIIGFYIYLGTWCYGIYYVMPYCWKGGTKEWGWYDENYFTGFGMASLFVCLHLWRFLKWRWEHLTLN